MPKRRSGKGGRRVPPPSDETLERVRKRLEEMDRALFGDKPAISGKALEESIRRMIQQVFNKSPQ